MVYLGPVSFDNSCPRCGAGMEDITPIGVLKREYLCVFCPPPRMSWQQPAAIQPKPFILK